MGGCLRRETREAEADPGGARSVGFGGNLGAEGASEEGRGRGDQRPPPVLPPSDRPPGAPLLLPHPELGLSRSISVHRNVPLALTWESFKEDKPLRWVCRALRGESPTLSSCLGLGRGQCGPSPPPTSSHDDPPGRPVGTLTLFVALTTVPRSRCPSVTHLSTLLCCFHPPLHSSFYLHTHPFRGSLPNLHFL